MPAFSRGLGTRLPSSPIFTLCARQPLQPFHFSRFINTTTPLRAAAKPLAKAPSIVKLPSRNAIPNSARPQPQPTPKTQASPKAPPTTYAYVQALAQKQQPTLLYESASHFWLKFSAWSAAIFCYGYAGFNYWTVIVTPPPDLTWWVPHAFGLICIAMGGVGSWVLLGSSNIIKTIRAIPTARVRTATPAAAPRTTPIHVELTIKRLVPFFKPKVVTAAPEDLSPQTRLYHPVVYQTIVQREAAERQEKARQDAQWEHDRTRLMSVPFRHAGRGMKTAWRGISRALTKEGFARLTVGKTKYKLDMETGWALEGGRALERIATIEGERKS